jgi:hypothetical protein
MAAIRLSGKLFGIRVQNGVMIDEVLFVHMLALNRGIRHSEFAFQLSFD